MNLVVIMITLGIVLPGSTVDQSCTAYSILSSFFSVLNIFLPVIGKWNGFCTPNSPGKI